MSRVGFLLAPVFQAREDRLVDPRHEPPALAVEVDPRYSPWGRFAGTNAFRAEDIPDTRRPGYDGLKEDSP